MKHLYLLLISFLLFSCETNDTSYTGTSDESPAYSETTESEYENEESIDCSDAKSAASNGYDYARQAYHSEAMEDIQYYARKAMDEFESAMSYASDCGCDEANYAADEAYEYARKAYNADTVEDGESYAKRAMDAGEDVESYASDCENQ
ncbi:hypothetical protein [uncultured Pontibacter sp.]|uniref:hypothetical protein n=1 Tax=uncultured Pontibacter sp. TaxID=453356 RepID=UPI0026054DA6|nr:hypothetical protein [uncultured Pontibacter sp.]